MPHNVIARHGLQDVMAGAVSKFLPALIRLVLPTGINCARLIKMVQEAYIQVIAEDYGVNGEPATLAKISLLSGLTKKEVIAARQRKPVSDVSIAAQHAAYRDACSALLTEWGRHEKWSNNGEPRELELNDEDSGFIALAKKFFGDDVAPADIVMSLISSKAAIMTIEGKIKRLKFHYPALPMSEEQAGFVGQQISDILATDRFNLNKEVGSIGPFSAVVRETDIAVRFIPEFRQLLEVAGLAFCDTVDQWLVEKKAEPLAPGEETTRMAIYLVQAADGWHHETKNQIKL